MKKIFFFAIDISLFLVYNKSVLFDTLFKDGDKIKNIFLFRNVIDEIINSVTYTELRFDPGDVIYDHKNYSRALGYISQGTVIIEQNGVPLKIARTGESFGAASLFNNADDYVSVIRAKTKCRIIFLSQETIHELITQNSVIALNYITFLSERIRYLNNKIASFTAGTVKERLAKYIVDVYNETESMELNGLSYSRLASSLNIGRASLYRVIDEFIEEGMIIKDNRRIIIKDIDKINEIYNKE